MRQFQKICSRLSFNYKATYSEPSCIKCDHRYGTDSFVKDEMRFSLRNLFPRKACDVNVTIRYGRLKQDLQSVKIVYKLDGKVIKENLFNNLDHQASGPLRHQTQLPLGDYLIIIELRYPGLKPHPAVSRENNQPEVEILRLHRSLSVHGNTEITLFLDKDDQC